MKVGPMRTLYDVLKVSQFAADDEIKRAFRKLAKETHPDINGNNPHLVNRFHEVTEAYSILSNSLKRREYDQMLNSYSVENQSRAQANSEYQYSDFSFTSAMLNERLVREYILMMHQQVEPYKRMAKKAIWVGLAWLFGGLLISITTYANALENGGSYGVFYGAIIFGGIQAFRGMIANSKINRSIEDAENELWKSFDNAFSSNLNSSGYDSMHNQYENVHGAKPQSEATQSYYDKYETPKKSKPENEAETIKDVESTSSDFNSDNKNDSIDEDKKIRNGNSVAVIITALLIVFFVVGYSSSNSQNTKATQNNNIVTISKSVDDDKITLNTTAIRNIINSIDYSKAVDFTLNNFQGIDLNRLENLFKNRGYSISGVSTGNLENLISAIYHYQKVNGLEPDGLAGSNTMKKIALDVTNDLIGEEVESYIKSDSNIQKNMVG